MNSAGFGGEAITASWDPGKNPFYGYVRMMMAHGWNSFPSRVFLWRMRIYGLWNGCSGR
jgi:hypothetical protein